MKKFYFAFLLLIIVTVSTQCKMLSKARYAAAEADTLYTTRHYIDWQGTYRGVLPCADCDGIQKTLTLDSNMNYLLRVKYLGKKGEAIEYTGTFTWNTQGNVIVLVEAGQRVGYFIVDGALAQLDMYGRRITGEMANKYILSKEKFALVEKYWKLVEVNGQPVKVDSTMGKEPYIIFNEEDNHFTGSGGCNSFSGNYELSNMNRIAIGQKAANLMECPVKDVESKLFKALQMADSYSIAGKWLTFYRARVVTLAKFKIVEKEEGMSARK